MRYYCRNFNELIQAYVQLPQSYFYTRHSRLTCASGWLHYAGVRYVCHTTNKKGHSAFLIDIVTTPYISYGAILKSGLPVFRVLLPYRGAFNDNPLEMHEYLAMIENYKHRIERERNRVATSRREYTGNLYLENMHRLENELEAFLNFIGKDVIMTHFLKQAVGNSNDDSPF